MIRFIESNSVAGTWYRVDLARGECTCKAGKYGSLCSHRRQAEAERASMLRQPAEERRGDLHARCSELLAELDLDASDLAIIATAIADEHESTKDPKPATPESTGGDPVVLVARGWTEGAHITAQIRGAGADGSLLGSLRMSVEEWRALRDALGGKPRTRAAFVSDVDAAFDRAAGSRAAKDRGPR